MNAWSTFNLSAVNCNRLVSSHISGKYGEVANETPVFSCTLGTCPGGWSTKLTKGTELWVFSCRSGFGVGPLYTSGCAQIGCVLQMDANCKWCFFRQFPYVAVGIVSFCDIVL